MQLLVTVVLDVACFLDSLATLGYPAYGCGIRYRYGMFKQKIENGYQVEVPDNWLKYGNPFEIKRDEYAVEVKFGGYVDVEMHNGRQKFVQKGYQSVRAVPYDMPIVGYGNHIVNTLRIWDAEAINNFNLDSFDKGEYEKAVEQENLEKWPIELFSRLLPRVYQIVEEINRRFVIEIQNKYPGDQEKIRKMAILYDGQVRMAHLAIAGSYSVNGVARLHTEILKKRELRDFYEMN